MSDGATSPGAVDPATAATALLAALRSHAARSVTVDRGAFLDRWDRWGPDLLDGLAVYGPSPSGALSERVLDLVISAHNRRRDSLRELDRARVLRPDWFATEAQVGYVCYTDRFAGTLAGVSRHLEYLTELGVTYLHLMPLLATREGPNDGGYAVTDYRRVRPDLGTVKDLAALADDLHRQGMSLTLDLVLNHVATEHAWAQAARRGELPYRDYFLFFPDRALPDAYERTLPEVFPDFAPGNFTWVPDAVDPADPSHQGAWVWTTFNAYQWDLNWANPDVFCEMLDVVLFLADLGVDCLRLDAIAFLWKRLGTDCQNQPEVHQIVQALRAAVRIAAPGVVFKAEAIVAPEQLPAYLGTGSHAGKVCDLAYQNSLMVQLWSALASGSAALARYALTVSPPKPVTTAWTTYARCHDDIGWAISDAHAAAVGVNAGTYRAFLAAWYDGTYPGSWARGEQFQVNPATGDARTSGTMAGLAGLDAARAAADPAAVDAALGRIFLLHAAIYGFGGIPLLYMGDEVGLANDPSYLSEPSLAQDNRWLHRPRMPWTRVERRHDSTTIEGRVFAGLVHLAKVRKSLPGLHAAVESQPIDLGADGVLALRRRHPAGELVCAYNVSSQWQHVRVEGILGGDQLWEHLSAFSPNAETWDGQRIYAMPPYAAWWLARRATHE